MKLNQASLAASCFAPFVRELDEQERRAAVANRLARFEEELDELERRAGEAVAAGQPRTQAQLGLGGGIPRVRK